MGRRVFIGRLPQLHPAWTFSAHRLTRRRAGDARPWRNTYAQLRHYFDWQTLQRDYTDLDIMRLLAGKPLATLDTMLWGRRRLRERLEAN